MCLLFELLSLKVFIKIFGLIKMAPTTNFMSDTQKLDRIVFFITYFPPVVLVLLVIIISLLVLIMRDFKHVGESKNIISKLFQGKKH